MINIIQEAYIGMYESVIITEEVHPEISSIMNSDTIQLKNKLTEISRKVRSLIASGTDTGLESDKPKKGSSRAVFFPKEQKEITVDGVKTKSPTAVKIAFSGQLDKHHGEETLLGEDQNRLESNHWTNKTYGILGYDGGKDTYQSNKSDSGGILAPVFESHDENHHLEMGRVTPLNAKDVAEATKTPEFPKGLTHAAIFDALQYQRHIAHGGGTHSYGDPEALEKTSSHPWVEDAIDMMHNTGMHPGDLSKRNMGIYTHPITGKKHLAIIDYGFSNNISRKYTKARRNMVKELYAR